MLVNAEKQHRSAVNQPVISTGPNGPPWIDPLRLRTLDPVREAGVALASIPLPREDHALVDF